MPILELILNPFAAGGNFVAAMFWLFVVALGWLAVVEARA